MNLEFVDCPVSLLTDQEWQMAATLFSENYGIWGIKGLKPGHRVRLNVARLKGQCGFSPDCRVSMAYIRQNDDKSSRLLVGHAFYTRKYDEELGGFLLWIVQLVVHVGYRGQRISVSLCNIACGPRLLIAAGIVSSNPLAIKSFERALHSPIVIKDADTIVKYAKMLVDKLEIPFMKNVDLEVEVSGLSNVTEEYQCVAHTQFYVDHAEVDRIGSCLSNWRFKELAEGDEYLAIIVPNEISSRVV